MGRIQQLIGAPGIYREPKRCTTTKRKHPNALPCKCRCRLCAPDYDKPIRARKQPQLPKPKYLRATPGQITSSPSTDGRKSCTTTGSVREGRNSISIERRGCTCLEEAGHGLVGTADLDLEEGGLLAVAALGRALGLALLRVVPSSRPTEDILPLLAVEDAARVERLGDGVLVGAGPALEAVEPVVHGRHGQDVCAVGADWNPTEERIG